MHCSYAASKDRKLIVFLSPGVVNKAFYALNSDRVRFIHIPIRLQGLFSRAAQAASKMECGLRDTHGSDALGAFKWVGTRLAGGPQGGTAGTMPVRSVSEAGFRFTNDSLGVLFDRLTLKTPSLRSLPFSEYTSSDYFDFRLPLAHFHPLTVQGRFAQRGETLLRDLGLSASDWFVCLHARESSFLGDDSREWMNEDITNYLLAIEYITDLGGHVIRMGDQSMKRLPPMTHVIDYAHSEYRSGFADLYLCSRARFFIGCISGLHVVAQLFNTPLLNVNMYPISCMDISARTLIIFKRVYDEKKRRYIHLRELVEDPTSYHRLTDGEYRDGGLRIVENTPTEILSAVQEMLRLLSEDPGFAMWAPEQHLFQTRIRDVLVSRRQQGLGHGDTIFYPDGICRIGLSYYRDNW